jgi:hypothetical protein
MILGFKSKAYRCFIHFLTSFLVKKEKSMRLSSLALKSPSKNECPARDFEVMDVASASNYPSVEISI